MNTRSALALVCACAIASHAQADGRRFTFAGVIQVTTGPASVQVGERYVIQYVFDPATPDVEPSPGFGSYMNAISELRGVVGSYQVDCTTGDISISDNAALGDVYGAASPLPLSAGGLEVHLVDYGSSVFSDDHLPLNLSMGLFEWTSVSMHVHGGSLHWGASGAVTGFCAATACYADCTQDGALTVADFGCFQTRFVLGEACADCNLDAFLTAADFGCFQTAFVVGCP